MDTPSASRPVKRYLITAVFADDIGFPTDPNSYFDEKSWNEMNNRFKVSMTEEQCELFFNLPNDVRSVLEVCIGQLHEPAAAEHFLFSAADSLPLISLYKFLYLKQMEFSGWFEPGGNIRYWGTFSYGSRNEEHHCVAEEVLLAMDRVSYMNQGFPTPSMQLADDRFVKIFTSELEQDVTGKSAAAIKELQLSSQVSDAVFKRTLHSAIRRDAKSGMDLLATLAWTKGMV